MTKANDCIVKAAFSVLSQKFFEDSKELNEAIKELAYARQDLQKFFLKFDVKIDGKEGYKHLGELAVRFDIIKDKKFSNLVFEKISKDSEVYFTKVINAEKKVNDQEMILRSKIIGLFDSEDSFYDFVNQVLLSFNISEDSPFEPTNRGEMYFYESFNNLILLTICD